MWHTAKELIHEGITGLYRDWKTTFVGVQVCGSKEMCRLCAAVALEEPKSGNAEIFVLLKVEVVEKQRRRQPTLGCPHNVRSVQCDIGCNIEDVMFPTSDKALRICGVAFWERWR